MDLENETYFEIFDSGSFIKLEPIEYTYLSAEMDWDKNWIKTKVEIRLENFTGNYIAEFTTLDFEDFERQISALYDNLNGTASFSDMENYLELRIVGDGIGHFEVTV
ncbi:hypothetical protein HYN48_13735 [Flavobacterium magnum]|uniref:Uncharacterized protein n=1 Tax=Flavobacterium magnum TaxID=2162713 RepID=A0A2S0RIG5_9FLAO|nr:hypothetical protein [Flavobacterium magnum]AWA31060.1 hypothetical protein HYN48_13735 [Flavobacterium magnum]